MIAELFFIVGMFFIAMPQSAFAGQGHCCNNTAQECTEVNGPCSPTEVGVGCCANNVSAVEGQHTVAGAATESIKLTHKATKPDGKIMHYEISSQIKGETCEGDVTFERKFVNGKFALNCPKLGHFDGGATYDKLTRLFKCDGTSADKKHKIVFQAKI